MSALIAVLFVVVDTFRKNKSRPEGYARPCERKGRVGGGGAACGLDGAVRDGSKVGC
jgi:hypothetical protein